MRPTILVAEAEGMAREAVATLSAGGDVVEADLDRAGLLDAARTATVLWVRLRTRIDADVLAAAPALRIIATPTTGLDHIDLDEASRRGIEVVSLRGATEFLRTVRATAEHTIALMLALLRHLPAAARDVEAGRWNRDAFKGGELSGRTVGIVGYGRLGRLVAGYLRAFGATVVACDPRGGDDVEMVSLSDLLARADLVSMHVNLDASTRGLIGRDELARMKRGAHLVNTARGDVLDEVALLDALRSGHLAGAALDVLAGERSSGMGDHPLVAYARAHPELIITPHIGGATFESMAKTEVYLATQVVAALARAK